jgi:hypothetical protein
VELPQIEAAIHPLRYYYPLQLDEWTGVVETSNKVTLCLISE